MDREINEYCELLFLSGIGISGWSLIHNIDDIPTPMYGYVTLYATDFGGLHAQKNDQLPKNKFFIIPPSVQILKRCKCCGQVIK